MATANNSGSTKKKQNTTGSKIGASAGSRNASAGKSRSTSQKSSSTSRGSARGKSRRKKKNNGLTWGLTISYIVVVAFAVLMFVSNIGKAGVVGNFLRKIQIGTLGVLGYLVPVLLLWAVFFAFGRFGNGSRRIKFIALMVGNVFVCAFIEMIKGCYQTIDRVGDYYTIPLMDSNGGGFIGGLVCRLFTPLLGKVGTYIVIVVFIIIALIMITELSLLYGIGRIFTGVKDGSTRAFDSARDDIVEYRDAAEQRRQERIERQQVRQQENRIRNEERRRMRAEKYGDVKTGVDMSIDMLNNEPSSHSLPANDKEPKQENNQEVQAEDRSAKDKYVKEIVSKDTTVKATAANNTADKISFPIFGLHKSEAKNRSEIVEIEPGDTSYDDADAYVKGTAKNMTDSEIYEIRQNNTQLESFEDDIYEDPYENQDPFEYTDDVDINLVNDEYDAELRQLHENDDKAYPSETRNSGKNNMSDNTCRTTAKTPAKTADKAADAAEMKQVEAQILDEVKHSEEATEVAEEVYQFPPVDFLKPSKNGSGTTEKELADTALKLQQTLASFGVKVTVNNVSCGPAVTRYELQPEQGVKVSKIVSLADDIKLNLAASDIRIEAPIPGKAAVGIEVPNREKTGVSLREIIESKEFMEAKSPIAFGAGKDIAGQVVVADIARMPHVLIAGSTGSGKSVCINTIIMSILYRAKPSEVKLIMVDPKVVELSVYNGIPHLMIPVVTDPKKAAGALNWAVAEMTDRYDKFSKCGVRDLKGYNQKIETLTDIEEDKKPAKLPQIVIIIDELADLMMVAKNEVEDSIVRLAQLARACGIHLVIATQRPSVDVITGLIKANVPSRIAFAVSSGVDSRTIIDMVGAEKLLGQGDMLFAPSGYPKPVRVQGAFVSDSEVSAVVEFLKANCESAGYNTEVTEKINNPMFAESQAFGGDYDEYFSQAGHLLIEKGKASIGMLQRMYKIGFNRAGRIMDQLEDAGVVGPEEGTKPRKILMNEEEFNEFCKKL